MSPILWAHHKGTRSQQIIFHVMPDGIMLSRKICQLALLRAISPSKASQWICEVGFAQACYNADNASDIEMRLRFLFNVIRVIDCLRRLA